LLILENNFFKFSELKGTRLLSVQLGSQRSTIGQWLSSTRNSRWTFDDWTLSSSSTWWSSPGKFSIFWKFDSFLLSFQHSLSYMIGSLISLTKKSWVWLCSFWLEFISYLKYSPFSLLWRWNEKLRLLLGWHHIYRISIIEKSKPHRAQRVLLIVTIQGIVIVIRLRDVCFLTWIQLDQRFQNNPPNYITLSFLI
jgi:hypothetical protein